MLFLKQATIIVCLSSIPAYILANSDSQTKTSKLEYEANKKRTSINNNVLDGNDKIDAVAKDVKKLLKTQSKSGNKVINVKKVKNMTAHQYDNSIHKTYQSIKYFGERKKCSVNCGVALKGWDNAKTYCKARGGQLPQKKDIIDDSKYNKNECSDCTYWTRTEAMRFNKIKKKYVPYEPKEVFVYVPSEEDFFQFSTTSTYVATCVSK